MYGILGWIGYPLGMETVTKSGRCAPAGVLHPLTSHAPAAPVASRHCVVTCSMSTVKLEIRGSPVAGSLMALVSAACVAGSAGSQKFSACCAANWRAAEYRILFSE